MISVSTGQIEAWLGQYLWPFIRIGACFMAAPVFGARFAPPRVRLLLAGAVTLIVAPLAPAPQTATFSAAAIVIAIHQILIGVATAFVLQLMFDALALGGQLLANSMGLSFAFNVDPLRGASTPVIGQFYMLLVTLTFLAMDGHLVLIEALARSFTTMPVGPQGLSAGGFRAVAEWGSQLFASAVAVALPGMTALLVVNLAFGVMSRAAPTLNLFAIGFPVALIAGLVILWAALPSVQATFIRSLGDAFAMIAALLEGG